MKISGLNLSYLVKYKHIESILENRLLIFELFLSGEDYIVALKFINVLAEKVLFYE